MSATAPGNGEGQPDAEREARRAARSERRDAPAERPGVMIPSGRKRLPLEAPLMRVVATGGIVGIGVVIAAIMTSQDSEGWLIGLVVSIVSVVPLLAVDHEVDAQRLLALGPPAQRDPRREDARPRLARERDLDRRAPRAERVAVPA